jgi:protein O-mannosyl-transferase
MRIDRKIAGIVFALAAACLVVFAQTFWFDFINIDDRAYVYENAAAYAGLNSKTIWWAFTAFYSSNWHPLTWISHIADVSVFGLNAGGHHAVNVLFHTANSILAFLVFRRFTGDVWKSAAVALLFAIHPAHVESVAWIAERKDVLFMFFWLLAMLAHVAYVRASVKGRATVFYVLTVVCFACALMSKPMAVTLPFVLLLCDYWPLERLKTWRDLGRLSLEKVPLFALTIASSVLTFLAQQAGGAVVSLEQIPLITRLLNVAVSYAKYVWMTVLPVNLGFWYPFEPNLDPLQVAGALLLLAAISIVCWRQRTKRKYLTVGWLWFLGTMVPVIGLVQVGLQSVADRYTYLPYFGLFIMIVWGAGEFIERSRIEARIVAVLASMVFLALGILAFRQASLWQNSETLYTNSLAITQKNYFIMTNLCLHYFQRSTPEIAEPRCSELLEATPASAESNNILGILRTQVGKYDQANRNFQAAIRMRPEWGVLYTNFSDSLAKQGKPDEAEQNLRRAISMKDYTTPGETLARSSRNLADAYAQKSRIEKAHEYYSKALEFKPDFAEAREGLEKLRK